MAEEKQAVDATETEAAEVETDWKAEAEKWKALSRDWEKKSKANKSAADELEQLKQEQMTEQEKANARAEAAEAELEALKAAAAREEAAREISKETGVPLSLLEYCADAEAMEAFAKEWKSQMGDVHAVAMSNGSRVIRGNDRTPTTAESFADFAGNLFNQR